jgi:hypothetical protein
MRIVLSFIPFLLLAGCGTMTNKYGPALLATTASNASTGIVIVSTGAKEKCISAATFLKVLKTEQTYYSFEQALFSVDAYVFKSDFSEFHGNLHAVRLPEGSYYLAPYVANPSLRATRIPKYDFSVKAGEVTYLGHYFMSVHCNPVTGSAQFQDEWTRDRALFRKMQTNVETSNVRKQILEPSGLAVGK